MEAKKIFSYLFLIIFSMSCEFTDPVEETKTDTSTKVESKIKVKSPNGGELLRSKGGYQIMWESKDIEKVKLEYSVTNGPEWKVIASNVESKGIFTWITIPDIATKQGRIRISDIDNEKDYDISDANFEITNVEDKSLTVVFPNGGEKFEAGSTQNVKWNYSGIDKVKIEYSTNNGTSWEVVVDNLDNKGSYEWRVPETASTQSKLKISNAEGGNPLDECDKPFTVNPKQFIAIIKPLANTTFISGQEFEIEWNSGGIEFVNIDYAYDYNTDGSIRWQSMAAKHSNSGKYKFRFVEPAKQYQIRITDAQDNSPVALVGPIVVKAAEPKEIKINIPNGGERWRSSGTFEIRWTASYLEYVKIQYTLDQKNWNIIDAKALNNGTYNWTIPNDIKNKSLIARIKISDPEDTTFYDVSDDNFTMYPPKYLRMEFPNGGDYISIQKAKDGDTLVVWESAGITHVNLDLSLNNGTTWERVATGIESRGFNWPFILHPFSALARLRISDASVDAGINPLSDETDNYFYLNIAGGGTNIQNRENTISRFNPFTLAWITVNNVPYVDIEYSNDNGKNWKVLEKNVLNIPGKLNKFEMKNIPDDIGDKIKIRIGNSTNKAEKLFNIKN